MLKNDLYPPPRLRPLPRKIKSWTRHCAMRTAKLGCVYDSSAVSFKIHINDDFRAAASEI